MMDLSERHPATQQVARWIGYEHLPAHLQPYSKPSHDLAEEMIRALPDGPELTASLRLLLQAKDGFVRAGVEQHERQAAEGDAPATG